ncbi:hypothetical protein CFP56_006068 [Quercus suber]|uniref:Uncharacterized protein n=1 Tax=Quercus suber TaxID=58331 RepID=A0AAW0L8G0_QUESU
MVGMRKRKKKCIAFGSIYPSMFQNLVRLNFKVTPSNWHVLLALLLVAPNLEVLVVNKGLRYPMHPKGVIHRFRRIAGDYKY